MGGWICLPKTEISYLWRCVESTKPGVPGLLWAVGVIEGKGIKRPSREHDAWRFFSFFSGEGYEASFWC